MSGPIFFKKKAVSFFIFLEIIHLLLLRNYRFEKNKVGTDETWITLFKFDEMQRNLEDFQERCDEYQTKESGLSLSCVPEVMIRVGIFSNKKMNKETISYVIILQQIDRQRRW